MHKNSKHVSIPLPVKALTWLPEQKTDDDNVLIFATLLSRMTTNKLLKQWVAKAGTDVLFARFFHGKLNLISG